MPPRRTQTTKAVEKHEGPTKPEITNSKPKRKRMTLARFAFWVGLISGLLSLIVIFSGIQSIPELISLFGGSRNTARATSTATLAPPTETLEVTLQPLVRGKGVIVVDQFETRDFMGFNFRLGTMAYRNAPEDLILTECEAAVFVLICDIQAEGLEYVGNKKSLEEADSALDYISGSYHFLDDEGLEEGKTYFLYAYGMHPAKFRITSLHIEYDDNDKPIIARLEIDYIYQPNDRWDFQGP